MSGLGWLNLQDYLGANAGNVDDQATKLDEGAFQQAPQANGAQPTSMGYGEYLARKRTAATEEGAAGLMGGDATDVMLARRGKSNARQPLVRDPSVMAGLKADEESYWAKQAERNKGIAQSAADARTKQDAAFGKAKKAYGERAQSDETALTNYGSQQSTRLQDEATRRYNEGRYGSLTGARQGQQSRRRFGGR